MRIPDHTIALAAEYLALTFSLSASCRLEPHTVAEYTRCNQIALQLAIELPAELWRAIVNGIRQHNAAGHWQAAMALRKARGLPDIPGDDMLWFWPGAGVQRH